MRDGVQRSLLKNRVLERESREKDGTLLETIHSGEDFERSLECMRLASERKWFGGGGLESGEGEGCKGNKKFEVLDGRCGQRANREGSLNKRITGGAARPGISAGVGEKYTEKSE